jgi:hypothetical protein
MAFFVSRHEEAPRPPSERPPACVSGCGAEVDAHGYRPGAARAVSSIRPAAALPAAAFSKSHVTLANGPVAR